MPIKITKRGSGFAVTEPGGQLLGKHKSKRKAYAQVAAIKHSQARRKRRRKK